MSSVNAVILIGRLGKDPELKFTQSGVAYCRVSLATSERWTDQSGQKQEKTEWHNIVFWKKLAENIAKYSRKGSLLYLHGRLETRSWDDQSGQKRYQTEIVGEEMKFLERRRDGEESPPSEPRSKGGTALNIPAEMGDRDIGDIPF